MSYERKKNAHLSRHLGASFIKLNELQIIPIDLNFHLKKCLEILIKNQLTKSNPKIIRGVNPPCLMPIMVDGN